MKTYKCNKVKCNKQATNILSFKKLEIMFWSNFYAEMQLESYSVCDDHIGTEDEKFYYPTIEEYTALRAIYEL